MKTKMDWLAPGMFCVFFCCAAVCAEWEAQVSGVITNEAGERVADAKIQFCGEEVKLADGTWSVNHTPDCVMPRATVNNDGTFSATLYNEKRRGNLWVQKERFAPAFATLTPGAQPAKIVIGKGQELSGSVWREVNGKPEPVKGAAVELLCSSGDLKHIKVVFEDPYFFNLNDKEGGDLPLIVSTLTNSTGSYSFQISAPPPGRNWFLICLGEIVPVKFEANRPLKAPDFVVSAEPRAVPEAAPGDADK